ncbi:MAG: hypothetical protein ACI9VM_000784 [Candidatus Azotimanducaceae bacterium]|jgi:hypothetical protein
MTNLNDFEKPSSLEEANTRVVMIKGEISDISHQLQDKQKCVENPSWQKSARTALRIKKRERGHLLLFIESEKQVRKQRESAQSGNMDLRIHIKTHSYLMGQLYKINRISVLTWRRPRINARPLKLKNSDNVYPVTK